MTTSITPLATLRLRLAGPRTGWSRRIATALLLVMQATVWAQAPAPAGAPLDPPGRVARLNLIEGAVSFAPGDAPAGSGDNAWIPATLNRPLTTGDRLWSAQRARTELHTGSTALRMNEQTSLDFLTLDDNVTQLRLEQGTINLRVRNLFEGQRLEVDTPNLAFVVSQPGNYRLDVNPASNTTRVVAQSGAGEIYGDSGTPLNLGNQQQASFTGTDLTPAAPGASVQDSFDAWALARDQREDQSVSARYVPRETVGYQQLDTYGDWTQDPSYGAVWLPRAVPVSWAPYRFGHWSWIAPWGWTWIDDAPWGFAPFHYGRWAQIGPRWAWVPGRLAPRPVYAPALVAFVGGNSGGMGWNLSMGVGGPPRPSVGWFPLAPGEAFRPAYRASPRYITQVNNNIVVNNTTNVTNIYRYQRQPAAVTALSAADFASGRPVRGNQQIPNANDLNRAQVVTGGPAGAAALPQRPDRRELARPALAAALPPAAVLATRPVVDSRNDRRDNNRRDERPQDRGGNPMAQAPAAQTATPATPATRPGLAGNPPANVRPEAAAPARREPQLQAQPQPQREQAQRPGPQPQPLIAGPSHQNARPAAVQPQQPSQAQEEQAQQRQLRDQQQRQQRQQAQNEQHSRQLQQQAQQTQQQAEARQQRQHAQQQQQEQQRQAAQAQHQQRAQQAEARQQANRAEAAPAREARTEGGANRHREP